MKEEFVSYEQAVTLKELGFDEPCLFAAYDGETLQSIYKKFISNLPYTLAPLRQQAFRWFREHCKDVFYIKMSGSHTYYINLNQKLIGEFETYEEAETFLIDQLINIARNGI
jgi:hypothetical protein